MAPIFGFIWSSRLGRASGGVEKSEVSGRAGTACRGRPKVV